MGLLDQKLAFREQPQTLPQPAHSTAKKPLGKNESWLSTNKTKVAAAGIIGGALGTTLYLTTTKTVSPGNPLGTLGTIAGFLIVGGLTVLIGKHTQVCSKICKGKNDDILLPGKNDFVNRLYDYKKDKEGGPKGADLEKEETENIDENMENSEPLPENVKNEKLKTDYQNFLSYFHSLNAPLNDEQKELVTIFTSLVGDYIKEKTTKTEDAVMVFEDTAIETFDGTINYFTEILGKECLQDIPKAFAKIIELDREAALELAKKCVIFKHSPHERKQLDLIDIMYIVDYRSRPITAEEKGGDEDFIDEIVQTAFHSDIRTDLITHFIENVKNPESEDYRKYNISEPKQHLKYFQKDELIKFLEKCADLDENYKEFQGDIIQGLQNFLYQSFMSEKTAAQTEATETIKKLLSLFLIKNQAMFFGLLGKCNLIGTELSSDFLGSIFAHVREIYKCEILKDATLTDKLGPCGEADDHELLQKILKESTPIEDNKERIKGTRAKESSGIGALPSDDDDDAVDDAELSEEEPKGKKGCLCQ
jgi:hypothetical protein